MPLLGSARQQKSFLNMIGWKIKSEEIAAMIEQNVEVVSNFGPTPYKLEPHGVIPCVANKQLL